MVLLRMLVGFLSIMWVIIWITVVIDQCMKQELYKKIKYLIHEDFKKIRFNKGFLILDNDTGSINKIEVKYLQGVEVFDLFLLDYNGNISYTNFKYFAKLAIKQINKEYNHWTLKGEIVKKENNAN